MIHVNKNINASKRVKKIRKYSKGYVRTSKGNLRAIMQRKDKALQYSTAHLKRKKNLFRNLWIQRINAGVREHGMTYSKFINKLFILNIKINRKMLAELAIYEPLSFKSIVDQTKQA